MWYNYTIRRLPHVHNRYAIFENNFFPFNILAVNLLGYAR